jgi:transposase
VHLSETCDEGRPRIITEVQTTAGPVADGDAMNPIHTALADKGLLPAQHIADTGYLSAGQLVQAQRDFGLDLVGPVRVDARWQAKCSAAIWMRAARQSG